jgi:hexosaminidase
MAAEDAAFRLDLAYWPASETEAQRYRFRLIHGGTEPITGFALGWSGPGRVDPEVPIEHARLLRRVSNYTEVTPPAGFTLHPGEVWEFVVRGTNRALRHWTDAAQAAFVIPASGGTIPVAVGVCAFGDADLAEPKLGVDLSGAGGPLTDGMAVVPRPNHVAVSGAINVTALAPYGAGKAAVGAFARLALLLFPSESLVSPDGLPVRLTEVALSADAYRLAFTPAEARIEAGGAGGFLYGLITLAQMLRGARDDPAQARFPDSGEIADAPRFPWRGAHLDVARQFYSMDELRQFLAVMAWNKLNRFHLHLTEDEAWRWEVSAYPELVATGAYRGHGLPLPPLLGSGAERYGGFYTKTDLRDLVAFAARLNIEIMPEIDVPGHCFAAVMALPWLRDPGENGEYQSVQGFTNNSLSPAVPRTMAFIETLFEELMEIFPGQHIHVGADEVPEEAWHGSPLARSMLEGLGGGGATALQAAFLRRLHAQLQKAGRITGAWEEGAHGGGVSPEASLMFAWRDAKVGGEMAALGYDVVMSPGQAYYLDMALSNDWWEPGAHWAGHSSVENSYRFEPASSFAPEHLPHLRGVQACIWSEPMSDRRVFQRLVFPRLSAIAETGWTQPRRKSWRNFAASVSFMPSMYGDA